MCDTIIMPDGKEIWTISKTPKNEEACLCWNNQKEILSWIINNIPEFHFNQTLLIFRTPFGYEVKIREFNFITMQIGKEVKEFMHENEKPRDDVGAETLTPGAESEEKKEEVKEEENAPEA